MSDLKTYSFGAQHAEIAGLTSDDAIAGQTYGEVFDVPGLKSIASSASSNTVELRGDNRLIVKETTLQSVEVTLEFAMWDANIFALLTGAELVENGGAGYSLTYTTSSTPAMFSLRARPAAASGGNTLEIFYPKLIITNLPDMLGLVEEDFKTVSITCEVIPTEDNIWMSWTYVEVE
jgi:hypothetical protein